MINKASHEATNNENYNTDRELVGGYDVIDGKRVINPAEAQVIRYYFSRTLELTNQYPSKPIDVVDKMVLDEVKDKWPEEYKSLIRKSEQNERLRAKRFTESGGHLKIDTDLSDIVSRELWEEVQVKL